MNEWLLIIALVGNGDATIAMQKLPSQQACIDAGEDFKRLLQPMVILRRYSCAEIKGSSRSRAN